MGYGKLGILVGFPVLLLFSLLVLSESSYAAHASITYSEPAIFEACEFQVFFPTKTTRKQAFTHGVETVIIQSVYDGESPFMRAECPSLAKFFPSPKEMIVQFRSILENYARISAIPNPQITIQETELGVEGTFAGVRKAGGFDIKIFGKVIIGNRSFLSLLVSEELKKFPSDKSIYFLNTVQAKSDIPKQRRRTVSELLTVHAARTLFPIFLCFLGIAAFKYGLQRFDLKFKLPLWLAFISLWILGTLISFIFGLEIAGKIVPGFSLLVFVIGLIVWVIGLLFGRRKKEV